MGAAATRYFFSAQGILQSHLTIPGETAGNILYTMTSIPMSTPLKMWVIVMMWELSLLDKAIEAVNVVESFPSSYVLNIIYVAIAFEIIISIVGLYLCLRSRD